ncbi:hypothetical protein E4T42_09669 [Aureobasidium subglaciale]|nr:hypothetical protein E4T42_09669 [Aureobasidium subglaciale]
MALRTSLAVETLFRRHLSDKALSYWPLLLPVSFIFARSALILGLSPWKQLALMLNFLWAYDDITSWRRNHRSPGPWFATISSLPLLYHVLKGDFYEWLERLHGRYGSRVRAYAPIMLGGPSIGPNRLSTSDANLVQRMDDKNLGYKRSGWYDAAIDPNPSHRSNVTSSIIPDEHERLRRQLTPAYNTSSGLISSLSESVGKHFTGKLGELTSQAGDKTTRVDLAHIIEVFSIQAFSNMAFGQVALTEVT